MSDFDTDLAGARRALSEGKLDTAEAALRRLLAIRPEDPALAHLAALTLKKQGRHDQARIAYERALAALPRDPALHAEYASLLDDLGESEASIAAYDRALQLAPALLDAAIDRAIVLTRRIDRPRGLVTLRRLAEASPRVARAWFTLSLMLRESGLLDEAEAAIDRAIELMPGNPKALHARAQLAFDRGRAASHLFREARAANPANRELRLAEVTALRQEGRTAEAQTMLETAVSADPEWNDGLYMLANIRWQSGEGENFARGYREALARRPTDVRLWTNLATITQRALGENAALAIVEEARGAVGGHEVIDNVEANIRAELGDLKRAGELFARLDRPGDPALELARIRYLLHNRAFEDAARRGLAMVEHGLGPHAWPYVSVAWRMLGDPRWDWLEGDRDFAKVFDLEGLLPELPALAACLRAQHGWKVHPFQQSLRGGTQTDNILFSRAEPEIERLVGHIRDAVRVYIDGLPPRERGHPLLDTPRESFHFTGSWSVRLTDAGFHVNHIHSQGWISSALYVSIPPGMGDDEADRSGWLTLGEPASEFGLPLEPLRMVRPKPGRLVLFPSWMWHGTRPFSAGERLTVAFDVAPG